MSEREALNGVPSIRWTDPTPLDETVGDLHKIGERRRDARALPYDTAERVARALRDHDRQTLPVAEIARLVELTTERVYQINAASLNEPTEVDVEIEE